MAAGAEIAGGSLTQSLSDKLKQALSGQTGDKRVHIDSTARVTPKAVKKSVSTQDSKLKTPKRKFVVPPSKLRKPGPKSLRNPRTPVYPGNNNPWFSNAGLKVYRHHAFQAQVYRKKKKRVYKVRR